jgi:hypothetical protein
VFAPSFPDGHADRKDQPYGDEACSRLISLTKLLLGSVGAKDVDHQCLDRLFASAVERDKEDLQDAILSCCSR